MIRLPIPNSDEGEWGTILNAYLSVAHTETGELKSAGLIDGAQQKSEKGQANGYASLNADGLVPVSQLPTPAVASGIGDYFGVIFNDEVPPDTGTMLSWDSETVHRGTSVSWTSGPPVVAEVDGVYAISLTVNWQDQVLGEDNNGFRSAYIVAGCGFTTNDQRFVVAQDPAGDTIQSLHFTVFLQAGTGIGATLSYNNTTDTTLTVAAKMLVTRVA